LKRAHHPKPVVSERVSIRGPKVVETRLGMAYLYYERYEIAGAEYDGVHPGRDKTRFASESLDEHAQQDVQGSCVEDRRNDECADLDKIGVLVVDTLGRPRATSPSDELS
jgi:hypothetical protein